MGVNAIETVLGAVVLVVAALFMTFAYSSADLQKVKGYEISARFPMVDGLKEGGDVKINGVKVGSISRMNLITEPGPFQYMVNIGMSIKEEISVPEDTIAIVASESLLGGKYLSLEIGIEEELLPADGTGVLTRTQAPMRLDDLIGQLIYSSKKPETPLTKSETGIAPSAPVAQESAQKLLVPASATEPALLAAEPYPEMK